MFLHVFHSPGLREDLQATREKNGIYLTQESFDQSEQERGGVSGAGLWVEILI